MPLLSKLITFYRKSLVQKTKKSSDIKIIMTLLIRDNQDILEDNIEHHIRQGIDFFIITDNRSTDTSRSIAERYVARGIAEIIDESGENYNQALWVTRMARRAYDYHADWVINNDADEFWISQRPGETVRETIQQLPQECRFISAQRWNAIITKSNIDEKWPISGTLFDRQSINSLGNPLPPKVAHRADPTIQVEHGNHCVQSKNQFGITDTNSLMILHYPFIGYKNYENKIRLGGRSYASHASLADNVGATWRNDFQFYLRGTLREICLERLPCESQVSEWKKAGRVALAPNPITVPSVPIKTFKNVPPLLKRGIITLADENYFFCLRLLVLSINNQVPIAVYDLGLSSESKKWLKTQPAVQILKIPDSPLVQEIKASCRENHMAKKTKREWPLWICPELILNSPFDQVFWIDADAIILRGIEEMFERLEEKPFITMENLAPDLTDNPNELYTHLPVNSKNLTPLPIRANAGVSGWQLSRDLHLLEAYNFPIRQAFCAKRIPRELIRWHDQGALIWALQFNGYDEHLLQEVKWNLCVKHSPLKDQKINSNATDTELRDWIDQARILEQSANIVHWNGHTVLGYE